MRGFLLPRVARMRGKGVVEVFPIDVLRMRRQVTCDRRRQIVIGAIRHRLARRFGVTATQFSMAALPAAIL